MSKLKNITEVSKSLNLESSYTKKPANYILRYWEKEFKEIKPIFINNRRYYNDEQIKLLKFIKSLLKDDGLTISGVKKILKTSANKLDDSENFSLKELNFKVALKKKSKLLLKKINKIKSYGKENSS